jgi:hypothetical protein
MIIDGEVSDILAIQVVSQPSTLHSSGTIAARHSRNATGLAAPGYNWRTLVEADISRSSGSSVTGYDPEQIGVERLRSRLPCAH